MPGKPPPNPLNRVVEPVIRKAALACGYLLLFLALALSTEIICRKIFTISLSGIDDLGGYVLAISTAIGAGYALFNRQHTRVDILVTRLPAALQRCLNVLAMICMAGLAIFAAWRCSIVLLESVEFGSLATNPLQTPLWQPQSVWLIGIFLFALTATGYAIHALWLLVKNKPGINTWYGVTGGAPENFGEEDGRE